MFIHFPVNSCLTPLCSLHGLAVTTVEGIGSVRGKLHPIQRLIAENHGSQCGFCTPGIVMSMYTLLRNNPQPTQMEIQETFDGNLCRCTGYRPILEGFKAFSVNSCPMGENCCQNQGTSDHDNRCANNDHEGVPHLYDPSQELLFPPELKILSEKLHRENLRFESPRVKWISPASLAELLAVRRAYPECKLVNGNTEIGIETKFKKITYPVLVSVARIPELCKVQYVEEGVKLGASLSLNRISAELKAAIERIVPEHKTRSFAAVAEMLKWFAGHQIRSVACLAGNIMTASPISDLNPLLLACKAVLDVIDTDGNIRQVVMDENFFTGYRQTCLNTTDTVLTVFIPYTKANEYFFGYKQANRKEDDIAIVNAGMRVDLGESVTHVQDISLAFGGMSITTVLATKTMKALIGRPWDDLLLHDACSLDLLPADLPLAPGSPGGMVAYRRTLTLSFFYRFYTAVTQLLQQKSEVTDYSAASDIPLCLSRGSQVYHQTSDRQPSQDLVGRPIAHSSAYKQATGEAVYVDDVPVSDGELFAGFVMSIKAHAKILSVDPSLALTLPGVVDYVTAKDVPGCNNWNDYDDLVFAPDKTLHEGQILGMILADNLATARHAASQVKVEYEELKPIITIQEAIQLNSYFDIPPRVIQCGDIDQGLSLAEHVIEGEFHLEAQEHFYLEPHACIVYPRDVDEYHVISMTHMLDVLQVGMSKVLGVPESNINVTVRRIGGSFGGKQARHGSILFPAAVGAYKTQRPVRAVLDRDEDMKLTGTRHPILAKYKVGFTADGQLMALKMTIYLNCGMSMDTSPGVAERCLLAIGNSYKIPHVFITTKLCRTNIASCTAFRGYGVPQGVAAVEHIIQHVAEFLNQSPEKIRAKNFYHQGDRTAYGQVIQQSNLLQYWEECLRQSDYHTRQQNLQEFNRSSRWKKRGMCITPLTSGVGYPVRPMNQGTALVNIYKDGSVLLLTGAVEMGQGLHIKLIQIATRVLDVPEKHIRVPETSTYTNPNHPPTAGSMGTDLIGMATLRACEELKRRLAPYRKDDPTKDWQAVVSSAILDRECLSAIGHYKVDTPGMDWTKNINSPFPYFSFGAACCEVEIDCLTGDHQVLRTDIVIDVGHSLNPAIDIGQIEGAFVQGYGMLVLEQYKVSGQGKLLTSGPGNYKIPAFSNIPQEFNVTLLKNKGNPRAVYSSKGIGEPPQCLAISAFLAIKSAISAARTDAGCSGYFQLDSPATPDRIRMSCIDQFSEKFRTDDEKDNEKPWYVKL
ncbi:hypothetical protein BsWGS_22840 [Bradybaena similaris]